jgi:hypothetical protein
MKRSSCLSPAVVSVLVSVGLSVTTASVAFAAPSSAPSPASPASSSSTEPSAKPALVAQNNKAKPGTSTVQPSDPAPTEGGAAPTTPAPAEPAEPTPAPASAAEPGPTPAISIGSATGAPATDAPNGSATEPGAKPKPRPWAGTQIFATSSMTTATVFKGQNQYSNPTVDGSIWLQPRYALSEAFQLRGLLIFSYEFTNSDDTVTKNEPRFSDTSLSLFYRKIPELPGGIKPAVALNSAFPTSPESRARTLLFSPGVTLQLVKAFEHVLGGEIDVIGSSVYSHPFYRKTTPEIRNQTPYAFQCVGGTSCQDQLSGTFNVSDSVGYSLILTGEWGKWSPALFYRGTSQWAYHGSDVQNPVDGTTVSSPAGFDPTHVRQRSYFSAWLDYNANSWLTAEVGYWLDRTMLGEDGTRGNPFFDRYQDMRVYIGASFNIDNIMKQLEGGPAEAGIVRAKAKGPIGHF